MQDTCTGPRLRKSHQECAQKSCCKQNNEQAHRLFPEVLRLGCVSCARGESSAVRRPVTRQPAPDLRHHPSHSTSCFNSSFPVIQMALCMPFALKFNLHNQSSEAISFCTSKAKILRSKCKKHLVRTPRGGSGSAVPTRAQPQASGRGNPGERTRERDQK